MKVAQESMDLNLTLKNDQGTYTLGVNPIQLLRLHYTTSEGHLGLLETHQPLSQ